MYIYSYSRNASFEKLMLTAALYAGLALKRYWQRSIDAKAFQQHQQVSGPYIFSEVYNNNKRQLAVIYDLDSWHELWKLF